MRSGQMVVYNVKQFACVQDVVTELTVVLIIGAYLLLTVFLLLSGILFVN